MNYITQLTFLRFLAAILIVIYHYGTAALSFSIDAVSTFVSHGWIAVSFFFFLSGVVLTLSYSEKTNFSKRNFFIKRVARLYPVYLLAFFATLVLGMIFNNSFPMGGSVILQMLSLHAFFPEFCLDINYPSWSISVEVFFYLLFPYILRIMKRMGNNKIAFFIILFWILSVLQHYLFSRYLMNPGSEKMSQFINFFPLWHLNTFLAGILCAKYIMKRKHSTPHNYTQPRLLFAIGTLAFFVLLSSNNFIVAYAHNGLLAPVFFLIIAGLATDKSVVTRFLGNKTLVLLGNASYGIYLLQFPVYIILCALIGADKLDGAYFYVYVIVLVLLSVLIYIGFEEKTKALILKKWVKN